MNLLDENFPQDQRPLLLDWGISCRQIGREIAASGSQDQEIIPVLHRLARVTFFTQDQDFFDKLLAIRLTALSSWMYARMMPRSSSGAF